MNDEMDFHEYKQKNPSKLDAEINNEINLGNIQIRLNMKRKYHEWMNEWRK